MPKSKLNPSRRLRAHAAHVARVAKSAAAPRSAAPARTTCIVDNCDAVCKRRMILCRGHQNITALEALPRTTEFSRTEVHLLTGLKRLDFVSHDLNPIPLSMFIDELRPSVYHAAYLLSEYKTKMDLARKAAEEYYKLKHEAIQAEVCVINYLHACTGVMDMELATARELIEENGDAFDFIDAGQCVAVEQAINL